MLKNNESKCMNKQKIRNLIYFLLKTTVVITVFLVITVNLFGNLHSRFKINLDAKIVDTKFNKVGIDDNDECKYSIKDKTITCKSGKCFKNTKFIVGSSTGTPPWLMFKNYIGYYLPKSNKHKKLPGQARRVIFCDGKCELIKDN